MKVSANSAVIFSQQHQNISTKQIKWLLINTTDSLIIPFRAMISGSKKKLPSYYPADNISWKMKVLISCQLYSRFNCKISSEKHYNQVNSALTSALTFQPQRLKSPLLRHKKSKWRSSIIIAVFCILHHDVLPMYKLFLLDLWSN